MNGIAVGGLCVAACLFSGVEGRQARRALSAFALEQMERVFDVVERVFRPA